MSRFLSKVNAYELSEYFMRTVYHRYGSGYAVLSVPCNFFAQLLSLHYVLSNQLTNTFLFS